MSLKLSSKVILTPFSTLQLKWLFQLIWIMLIPVKQDSSASKFRIKYLSRPHSLGFANLSGFIMYHYALCSHSPSHIAYFQKWKYIKSFIPSRPLNLLLSVPGILYSTTLRLDKFNSAFAFQIKYYNFREVTPVDCLLPWHIVIALLQHSIQSNS